MFKIGQKVYCVRFNSVVPFSIDSIVTAKDGTYYLSVDLEPNCKINADSVYRTKKEAYLHIMENLWVYYNNELKSVYERAKEDKVHLPYEVIRRIKVTREVKW